MNMTASETSINKMWHLVTTERETGEKNVKSTEKRNDILTTIRVFSYNLAEKFLLFKGINVRLYIPKERKSFKKI